MTTAIDEASTVTLPGHQPRVGATCGQYMTIL
jgi:hypothetical protein